MEIKKKKQIYIMAILLVLVLLAAAFLFAQESPGGSTARIERGAISSRYDQPLRVGLDQALPPYAYVDSNGVIKGFLADLVYALALEYGLDVELYSRQREEMMASLNKGDLDLVISNAVPPEGYLTSDVLISSEDTIFVRRDNTYISALEELRNLSVAINTISLTSSIGSYINEHSQDKLKIVINQEHGFLLLLNMEVEAYIGNKASGHYLLQKWDQEDFFKSVGESFNIGDFRFFAAAEHEELLALLNSSLSIAKQNGTYDKVGGKWFGQSIKSYEKQIRQIIYIALACLVLFLLLAIIALIFNNRLKKEVDSRTLALNQANQELLRQRNEINAANHFKEEILNSVQNGIITLDAQGALTFINNRAADILELSPGELLGSMIFQSPLFYWLNKEKLAAVLSGQGPYLGIKAKIQGADEVKFIIYQIGALGRDKGDSTGAVISFKDISKEKRLEEELLRQDQSRIMRMQVSEFIHEIRTPMTSIKTLADLLPERIADPQFQTQLAEIINSEMDRISKMVGALENYANPRPNQMDYCELLPLVNNLQLLLSSRLAAKGIELECFIPEGLLIYVDKMHLIQILINLINNSIDAFNEPGTIRLLARQDKGMAIILVEDDGEGIAAANLERIFEPFFTTRQSGTGLGLYICNQLAIANSGSIQVKQREPKGTRIEIILIGKEREGDNGDG